LLFEVGFYASVIEYKNKGIYVAYSHKDFVKQEAISILDRLIGGTDDGDKK